MCANDGKRIYIAVQYVVFASGIIPPLGSAVYSYYLLGFWGLFGYAIFFSLFPIQVTYLI